MNLFLFVVGGVFCDSQHRFISKEGRKYILCLQDICFPVEVGMHLHGNQENRALKKKKKQYFNPNKDLFLTTVFSD